MISEFDLIKHHFQRPTRHTELGVGDDAALIRAPPGCELVVSTDMLVAGTHFLPDDEPEALGWKALAVSVSDMAAMGAVPKWALLAIALPQPREAFVAAFARGLFACADVFGIDLVGGDTTRGPLNFCVTIVGEVPHGAALRRDGAWPDEDIWISGRPGRAALGLAQARGLTVLGETARAECLAALRRPQPRLALGMALRGIASSAIDVSDGLLADLGHILERSGVGAIVDVAEVPRDELDHWCDDAELVRDCLLAGGDDYELIFTAAAERRDDIDRLARRLALPLTRIGSIADEPAGTLHLREADGSLSVPARRGYDHFAQ
jgi:thiamine-monophosphate kinase